MPMTDASLAAMSAHGAVVLIGEHLVKRHGNGVLATDDVSIAIPRGTVHAVIGARGAGLSTLLRLLAGVEPPTSGRVAIDGVMCRSDGLRGSVAAGVGLVPRHSNQLPALTVAQNVVLGAKAPHGPFLGVRRGRDFVRDLCRRFAFQVDPDARVANLSASERQQVEMLKVLHRGARVLLLDDPTASSTTRDTETLFLSMRRLAAAGVTVVFSSSRPAEAWHVAESFTALRAGRVVARGRTIDVAESDIASMLTADAVTQSISESIGQTHQRSQALKVVDLNWRDSAGDVVLDGLTFDIGPGEIVGLCSNDASARATLVDLLTGHIDAAPGSVWIDGRPLAVGFEAARHQGVSRFSEDRSTTADGVPQGCGNRVAAETGFPLQVGRRGWLDARVAAPRARELIERYRSRAGLDDGRSTKPRPRASAAGHGSDHVVFDDRPRLVVAQDASLRDDVLAWRAAGTAVLLVSHDTEALIDLCDRVSMLVDGRITTDGVSAEGPLAGPRTLTPIASTDLRIAI